MEGSRLDSGCVWRLLGSQLLPQGLGHGMVPQLLRLGAEGALGDAQKEAPKTGEIGETGGKNKKRYEVGERGTPKRFRFFLSSGFSDSGGGMKGTPQTKEIWVDTPFSISGGGGGIE